MLKFYISILDTMIILDDGFIFGFNLMCEFDYTFAMEGSAEMLLLAILVLFLVFAAIWLVILGLSRTRCPS